MKLSHTHSLRLGVAVAAILGVAVGPVQALASGSTVDFNSQTNLVQPAPFPQNEQNEPAIAQNPKDSLSLIAGANDEIDLPGCTSTGCPFVANVGLSGVYVSHDGGSSWTQFSASSGGANTASFNADGLIHTLPGFGTLASTLGVPGLASDGDPAIAFNADGVAYYASLAGVRGTNLGDLLTVSRSTNGGSSWSNPVLATNKDNPADFNDKEAVWVDKSSTSRFKNNVYVSWTLFIGRGSEPIMFSRSTDGGQTFSAPNKLGASYNNNSIGGRQGSTIRTDSAGDIYVIWEGGVTINGTKTSAQVFAKSTDGGVTFSNPDVIARVTDIPSPLPGSSFRNDSFPSADIGPNGAIYVAWTDYRTGRGQVRISSSVDGGSTWSPSTVALDVPGRSTFFPGVAVTPDGTRVTVAAQALDAVPAGTAPGAGVVFYDSYLATSVGGGSFSAPIKISTASSDPDGSSTNSLGAQFQGDYNTLITDNQHAWFIWTDARAASPCDAVDDYRAGTSGKPSVPDSCPDNFGNTDIFVGRVTY
ncbi:MAG TPA: sialidase family protein [Candidatus Dormibacteraeota bacterium]